MPCYRMHLHQKSRLSGLALCQAHSVVPPLRSLIYVHRLIISLTINGIVRPFCHSLNLLFSPSSWRLGLRILLIMPGCTKRSTSRAMKRYFLERVLPPLGQEVDTIEGS